MQMFAKSSKSSSLLRGDTRSHAPALAATPKSISNNAPTDEEISYGIPRLYLHAR